VLQSDATDIAWVTLAIGDISDLAYATPNLTLGTANAAGVASSVIRSDATILAFDATVPGTIEPDDTAIAGVATVAARRDHQHAIAAAIPVDISTANSEGNSTSFSRANHVHNHPSGLGANLHHNQSHVLATGTALGPDHTISGAAAGEVLRALSATTAAFDQLSYSDLGGTFPSHVHSAAAGQGGATISATLFNAAATVSAVHTHSANLILDDGAGDSPQLQFVGGSNNDTVYFYLDDDAGAGNSDLRMVLAEAAGASRFYIADSELSDVFQVYSDGTVIANGQVSVGPNATVPTYTLEAIENQNAVTRVQVENTTSDTAARVEYRLVAGGAAGGVGIFSAGYTTAGTSIADSMRIYAGATTSAGLNLVTATTADISFYPNEALAMTIASGGNVTIPSGNLDINGNDLILDVDGDSIIHSPADDVIAIELLSAEVARFTGDALAVGVTSVETGTVIQAERDDGGVGWFVETNTFGTARDVLPTGAVDRGIQFGSVVYNVTDADGPTFTNSNITYSGVSNQNVTIYSGGGATVVLEVNTDGSCYVSQTAGAAKSLEVSIRYAFL
jgi:hypothetical protein